MFKLKKLMKFSFPDQSLRNMFHIYFISSASLPTFATIFSCIFGGFLGQLYGRRLTMILVAPFMALSFVCQATASEVGLFQLGRLLTGIAFGLVSGPAGVSSR